MRTHMCECYVLSGVVDSLRSDCTAPGRAFHFIAMRALGEKKEYWNALSTHEYSCRICISFLNYCLRIF